MAPEGDLVYREGICYEKLEAYWSVEKGRLERRRFNLEKNLASFEKLKSRHEALKGEANTYGIFYNGKRSFEIPIFFDGMHIYDYLNPEIEALRREVQRLEEKSSFLTDLKREIEFYENSLRKLRLSSRASA